MDQNINAGKSNLLTLKNEKTSECYDILNKKTHLVARTGFNGDLEISDASVSRSHAEISLVKKTIGSKVKLVLEVVDKKSKFGTFVNTGIELDERIESNCPIILELGDRIRFGIMGSIWTVLKYSIVACPSTLKIADKDVLKKSLEEIGGQVIREWSEQCTHLCMNSVTVTEKVLLCLASAKPIISVKYFVDLCKALSPGSSTELPFCVDYKPNLVEKILNPNFVSLDVNNKRKSLFFGKIFICSTVEQLSRLSKIVDAAGGKMINYFDGYIIDDDILNCKEHIVMQQDHHSTENSDKYRLILEKLEMKNKRPIPECDIGLSVIYSSTEKYCNPNYNVSLVNLQSQPSITVSQSSVILAPETEVLTVGDSEIYSVNTVADSHSKTQSQFKRPLEMIMDSEEIIMPNKRALLFDDKEKNNSLTRMVETNIEPYVQVIEPTPTNSNNIFQSSKYGNEKIEVNVEENFESFKRVIEPTPSGSNNRTFKFSEYDDEEKNNSIKEHVEKPTTSKGNHIFKSSNINNDEKNDSMKTQIEKNLEPFKTVIKPTLPSSNNTFKFSEYKKTVSVVNDMMSSGVNSCLASVKNLHTISNKNVKNVNNLHSNIVDDAVITKRKLQNVCSMLDNEDNDDLFDYMDIDEIEEHPKKKSKKELVESVFLPILSKTSSNNSKPSKFVEPTANNAVDPNFIMNLLSAAKGTGQFIDASKLSDKSSINVFEDTEHDDLLNSVIVETVKMVVCKPIKIQNIGRENHSSLQNFKKFKRKGPVMRIPHIVPLKLSPID